MLSTPGSTVHEHSVHNDCDEALARRPAPCSDPAGSVACGCPTASRAAGGAAGFCEGLGTSAPRSLAREVEGGEGKGKAASRPPGRGGVQCRRWAGGVGAVEGGGGDGTCGGGGDGEGGGDGGAAAVVLAAVAMVAAPPERHHGGLVVTVGVAHMRDACGCRHVMEWGAPRQAVQSRSRAMAQACEVRGSEAHGSMNSPLSSAAAALPQIKRGAHTFEWRSSRRRFDAGRSRRCPSVPMEIVNRPSGARRNLAGPTHRGWRRLRTTPGSSVGEERLRGQKSPAASLGAFSSDN